MIVGDDEDGNVAGVIARSLFRIRIVVLVLIAACAVYPFVMGLAHGAVPWRGLVLPAASVLLAGIVAYVHLRHVALAGIVCLAPLPGLIGATMHDSGLWVFSTPFVESYVFAFAIATCAAGAFARHSASGKDPITAGREAFAAMLMPASLAPVLILSLALLWLFPRHGEIAFGLCLQAILAGFGALIMVPFAASFFGYDESFVATANRAREWRERVVRPVTFVSVPRWGLSIAGIALVLAVLGWFAVPTELRNDEFAGRPALWGASVLFIGLLAAAARIGWREVVGVMAAVALSTLATLGLYGRSGTGFGFSHEVVVMAGLALFLVLAVAGKAKRHRDAGEVDAIARLRAIEEMGASVFFAVVGGIAAMLPFFSELGYAPRLALALLCAGLAALLFAPAIATAIGIIFPRHRSVEELYGRR